MVCPHFYPPHFYRKRLAHEREVRLVSSPSRFRAAPPEIAPNSLSIPWNPVEKVERVYVDPYAPEYFFDAVQAILGAIEPLLNSRLVWSQMKAAPLI